MFYILTVGKVRSPTLEALATAVTLWKLEEGIGADSRPWPVQWARLAPMTEIPNR